MGYSLVLWLIFSLLHFFLAFAGFHDVVAFDEERFAFFPGGLATGLFREISGSGLLGDRFPALFHNAGRHPSGRGGGSFRSAHSHTISIADFLHHLPPSDVADVVIEFTDIFRLPGAAQGIWIDR